MNNNIDWRERGSLEGKLFKMPFERMLDFINSVNELDETVASDLEQKKLEGWQDELALVWKRIDGRLSFIDFRIAFELGDGLPLKGGGRASHMEVAQDLHQRGAISDERLASALRGEPSEDLEAVQKYLRKLREEITVPPMESPGMLLCAVALSEIFLCSKTVHNGNQIEYFQQGQLRAIASVNNNVPDGPFEVFYPDGKTWMKGAYENGSIKPSAMKIFMPDGLEAKASAPQSWLH